MAQIDLRNSTIDILDGTTIAGAVNQPVTPPANGDVTMTVDGFTSALSAGMIFTVVGSTDSYEVVSSVGGSTPTAVTFTPALRTAAGLPVDNAVITVRTKVVRVTLGEGNLTFEEKRNMEYVHDRRAIAFVRTGDDEPMDVSFDFIWQFLTSTANDAHVTIEEAVKGTGQASAFKTSGADACEPYCVDLRVTYSPPCTGELREIITLPEYRWESFAHDLKAGTVASKGKCKVLTATKQRVG